MLEFQTGSDLIVGATKLVLETGSMHSPRGLPTKAILHPVVLKLENPAMPLLHSTVRKPRYRFGAAEAMWIASGSESAQVIGAFNSKMLNYSDDGVVMQGAYGPRVTGQLAHVVEVLKSDPDSRQAVLTTWRPQVPPVEYAFSRDFYALDSAGVRVQSRDSDRVPKWNGASWYTKDTPCTVMFHFAIVDGRLDLTVYMRSNDLWLGLPYDLLSFTTLQRMVASILNVSAGRYYHIVGNLHLYEPNFEEAVKMVEQYYICAPLQTVLPEFQLGSLDQMAMTAAQVLHAPNSQFPDGFEWYKKMIHRGI